MTSSMTPRTYAGADPAEVCDELSSAAHRLAEVAEAAGVGGLITLQTQRHDSVES